ncbi:prolyl oligopeptidase family serine peptidase [Streptomyces sp. NPDC004610]|uniref:prolyl oligopeptidase family serine peptidase n=1 Tax=unclassified Streptomyces TaxID=2593676 RepID=UPI0033BF899F
MNHEDTRLNRRRSQRRRVMVPLALTAVCGLTLAACSSGDSGTASAAASSAAPEPCPEPSFASGPGGAAPSGAPADGMPSAPPGGAAGGLPVAKTIAPSDNSTSTVYTPSGPEITCGTTAVELTTDVTYATPTTADGEEIPLKLDIQTPDTSGDKPLVVYLTGGGFSSAQKSGNLNQRTWVAEQGYVVASIEYRTVTNGDATYKDAVADVKSAVRHLWANAEEYGIDPENVAVWGQSAGGYLAAMTGATNGDESFVSGDHLDQSSDVQGVVDQFGPSDLSRLAADFDTAMKDEYYTPGNNFARWVYGPGTDRSIEESTPEIEAANPASHISGETAPFIEMHGTEDHFVSPSQTIVVHEALRAEGIESTRYVLEGADHGDLSFTGDTDAAGAWNSEQTMGYILDFFDKHLS